MKKTLRERIDRASIEAEIIDTEIELIKYASNEMGLFYQSLWRSIKTEKISFEKLMIFLELLDLELIIKPKKEKLPH